MGGRWCGCGCDGCDGQQSRVLSGCAPMRNGALFGGWVDFGEQNLEGRKIKLKYEVLN